MFLVVKKGLGYLRQISGGAWVGVVLIEIVVVVLGVYIAAALGTLQETAQQRQRLELIATALSSEIGPFVEQSGQVIDTIRDGFDDWEAEYQSGNRPLPYVLPATISLTRPHAALWGAMLDIGGMELLPIDLITQVADFYERNDRMVQRYNLIAAFSQDRVLPYLDVGEMHFYFGDSGDLRRMYQIHMMEFEALIEYAEDTVKLGRTIQLSTLFDES